MKLQLLIFILFFCTFSALGQVVITDNNHLIQVAEDGSYFTEKIKISGTMSADKKEVISIYFGELETVKNLEVKITDSKGKEKYLKKKDIVLSSVPTSSFYDGLQRYSFVLPAQSSPYKFSYSYAQRNEDLMFLSLLWFPVSNDVKHVKQTIQVPANFTLDYKFSEKNGQENLVQYQRETIENYTQHTFTLDQKETNKSGEEDSVERVRLIVYPTSSEPFSHFNNWYKELVQPHSTLNAETIAAIDSEIADLTTPTEKIATLYAFVQKRINYIDFEDGIGAIQPRDVNDVFAKKQGDCKDMSNLLVQSLKHAGIEANMAISSSLSHFTDLDFPSLSSANHCICVVPNEKGYIFLDATESNGIYGFPSRHTQGRHVFVINDSGGELALVPAVLPAENTARYQINLKQEKVDLVGDIKIELNGLSQMDVKNFADFTDENTVTQSLTTYFSNQSNNLAFSDLKLNSQDDKMTLIGAVNSSRILTDLGKKYYLSLNFLPFPHQLSQTKNEKETEKIIYETQNRETEILIDLAEAGTIIPLNLSAAEEGISFNFRIKQTSPQQIRIVYDYKNAHLQMSDEVLAAYHNINKFIRNVFSKTIIYEKIN